MVQKRKMQQQRISIAVIGEGITEQYYMLSLKSLVSINIKPGIPKHSEGAKYLGDLIEKSIKEYAPIILCLIDMDNKADNKKKAEYEKLKARYHSKEFGRKKAGLTSKVLFFETERCLELWFLYHFEYTTSKFNSYSDLERSLKRFIPEYEKTEKFFLRSKGLHQYITNKLNGDFELAKRNAHKSLTSKEEDSRPHTYSELGKFFDYIATLTQ